MQKTLPELLEAEFTASMEDKLDAIASGQENWERYIIGWNENYFVVALEKALTVIESQPEFKGIPHNENSLVHPNQESKIDCPHCGQKMAEIPSKSKKLHKDYFLKCSGCQAVMFYNKWRKAWELPIEKPENPSPPSPEPLNLTDHPCPVCGEKLAIREYEKDGQKKRMLVCSSGRARTDKKHQGVAYFESRNVFWSKKYGEISID